MKVEDNTKKLLKTLSKGDILVSVLVFSAIAVTAIISLVNWGAILLKQIRTVQVREQAFQIAEAGVDYYRWHLAQSPNDYKDGTTTPGPYYHKFYDKDGKQIGSYSLTIVPPPVGSTKVTITSTASTTSNPDIIKIIQVILAQPSLAQYAVVANDQMVFGSGTIVNGPIISNRGIHFDGIAHNVISSALATDTNPDNLSHVEWGVWTEASPADPTPPAAANNHNSDIFLAGRQYPVQAFPFGSLTVNLNTLQTLSLTGGVCSPPNCWTPSGKAGYHIILKNNNTYDIYRVKTKMTSPNNCKPTTVPDRWDPWTVSSQDDPLPPNNANMSRNYAIPSNGVIFVADDVWVDGTVNNTRVTIVAADVGQTDPTRYRNITINNDLLYTNFNGNDVVGLIAQGDVNVGLQSDDNLEINAALVAENGRVGRFYYSNSCSSTYYKRTNITLNGMIATNIRYGFKWGDLNNNWVGGYNTRNINFDGNLFYSPPPSFPLSSTQYQMISWRQLQ
ncbi:MAG: hypothetical protein WCK03_01055 [Candidatus Taylorbacteria bacterium]